MTNPPESAVDRAGASGVRLPELMASLSLATDLAMGQPLEYALCSCVLAVRLGEMLGLSEDELRTLVSAAIAETGATSPADLGKVMGTLAPKIKGRADGKAASDMVRAQLTG